MKTDYFLIQRLRKPTVALDGKIFENPFSFGGGYRRGGLTEEAFNALGKIWSYDYMGAAEFEFGALPESFERIKKNLNEYIFDKVNIEATATDYSGKRIKKIKKDQDVFYFCLRDDQKEVEELLKKFANGVEHDYRSKEYIGLSESIFYEDLRVVGWHDIENDFLFFIDKQMFENFIMMCDPNEDEKQKLTEILK